MDKKKRRTYTDAQLREALESIAEGVSDDIKLINKYQFLRLRCEISVMANTDKINAEVLLFFKNEKI